MDLDPNKWEYDIPVASHIRIEMEVSGRVLHEYHVGEIALKCIRCGKVVPLSPCSNCESTTYEPGKSTDGTVGVFCTKCEKGFSNWTCSQCGTENAVNKTVAKKKGCFIATAAFESGEAPEVLFLRKFRDDTLVRSRLGRTLILAYYRISPSLAKVVSRSQFLKRSSRAVLRHTIGHLKKRGTRHGKK